jgi:NifB/MoaA-like Fe-S oxidoreductase
MPTVAECQAAVETVDFLASASMQERGKYWVYGSDELYMKARLPLPPFSRYDDFEQLENGVGVVRYFEEQIRDFSMDLSNAAIGIVTGEAMGDLFPGILADLSIRTGAHFELIPQTNDLFGPSVTTAGLLPGRSFVAALADKQDLDIALIPAEALNDDEVFIDDISFLQLQESAPLQVRASHWIVDALGEGLE